MQPVETEVKVTESETLVDPDRTAGAYSVGAKEVKERAAGLPGRNLINLVANEPGWLLEANGVLHRRESEYETQYVVNRFPVRHEPDGSPERHQLRGPSIGDGIGSAA